MRFLIGWIMRIAVLIVIGLAIGLGISWGLFPVRMKNTTPGTLTQTDKDHYRVLIAENYLATYDLERAKARLELIDSEQASSGIKDQLERVSQETGSEQVYAALSGLERVLAGVSVKAMPTQTDTLMPWAATSTVTSESYLTPTRPYTDTNGTTSATPSPTSWRENINLISQTALCNSDLQLPLLQVEVIDQTGKPLSGVVIVISSLNGSERIITGLKPELGAGMVDFQMLGGIEYSLMIEGTTGPIGPLTVDECVTMDGEKYPGGWRLVIQY